MKQKIISLFAAVICIACLLAGCRESDRVAYNVSQQADNFNISRRLVAINTRTDKPVLEVIGNFAIKNNSSDELEVIVEIGHDRYKKHYVYLNEWITYTVEDLSGVFADPYHYEVNFLPQMIMPFTVTMED